MTWPAGRVGARHLDGRFAAGQIAQAYTAAARSANAPLQPLRRAADNAGVLTARAVLAIAALTGIALELGVHAASGRREAWDSPVFWTVGLPIAMVVSTLVGWCSRGRAWIGTLAVAPSQVATLMVRSGDIGSLWPLTLVLSAMLSAPFVFAAFVGSRIRREPTRAA